ncbi:MAG: hypothetical protein RLP12_12425, partial [Ekhidna sp.]
LIRSETFEINKLEPFASASLVADYIIGSQSFFMEINNSMVLGKIEDGESNTSTFNLNNVAIMVGMKLPLGR